MARISRARLKVILWQVLGYAFLSLGVLGMFLPILQGFLFLFVGLIILARHAPWAERLLHYLRQQHPRLDRAIAKAEAKPHEWRERAEAWWHDWRLNAACQARFWRGKMADLVRRYT
jgi:uncharacterized membrane protein YbaN (DUF454 family)